MQDYQTLIAEHDRLDGFAINMMAIVAGPRNPDGAIAARATLSIDLEDHLSREDSFLYDRLLEKEGDAFSQAVGAFHRDFANLTRDWVDYLRGWDADRVSADWSSFAQDTLSIMHRLRERIAAENDLLYPLALERGHIRLRAAA